MKRATPVELANFRKELAELLEETQVDNRVLGLLLEQTSDSQPTRADENALLAAYRSRCNRLAMINLIKSQGALILKVVLCHRLEAEEVGISVTDLIKEAMIAMREKIRSGVTLRAEENLASVLEDPVKTAILKTIEQADKISKALPLKDGSGPTLFLAEFLEEDEFTPAEANQIGTPVVIASVDGEKSQDKVFRTDDLRAEINCALATLTPQQASVIRLSYGLNGGKPMSTNKIAEKLRLSPRRIREIRQEAIGRLRHVSRSQKLRAYLG